MKVHYYEGNEIFISGIQGKEVRKNVITICKRCMETAEERILIGNGFQDLNQKEENRKLQQYVFEIAKKEKFERIRSACRKLLS